MLRFAFLPPRLTACSGETMVLSGPGLLSWAHFWAPLQATDGRTHFSGKVVLLLILACLAPFSLSGQGFTGDWRVMLSTSGQAQDTRWTGLTPEADQRALKESPLSWHFRLGAVKPVFWGPDFSFDIGVAYGLEINTLRRTFNHCYLFLSHDSPYICPLPELPMDNYQVHQFHLPMVFRYKLFQFSAQKMIFLSGEVVPGLAFFKKVGKPSAIGEISMSKTELRPYAGEINGGVGYKHRAWSVEATARVFSVREWDPVFHNLYARYFPDSSIDTHNPFKLWLTLSYDLRAGQPPRSWWGKKEK